MRIIQAGVLALSPLVGGANAPEPSPHLGTMALYSADGTSHQDYAVSSFEVSLQPAQASDAQDPASLRTMTATLSDLGAIDPFLIAWVTNGHARRRVIFTLNVAGSGAAARTAKYDLDATEVSSFEAGYSDGGGQASLSIDTRHMTLNGNRLF